MNNNYLRKIKALFVRIEQRVPYIPDFGDAWNVMKIFLISMLICVIYSFSQVQRASELYISLIPNIKIFMPYIVSQLLLLIFCAKIINRLKATKAILLIGFLNILCVYFVYSSINKNFVIFFIDLDTSLDQIAVSLGILFFFLIYFDWHEKNIDPANTMAKLMFLQSKMRPHFLFNTLNTIVSLVKKEPDTAKKMIFNLSELLRASIKEDLKTMCSLQEEITLCEKYLEIEKIRLGDRLSIIWNKDESILESKVPRLFLQPLIENGVLHGIQQIENGGKIEINIKKNLIDRLVIEIKNPLGDKKDTLNDNHNNISLDNIKERLNLQYHGDVSFKATSYKGFYYVYIEIPSIM